MAEDEPVEAIVVDVPTRRRGAVVYIVLASLAVVALLFVFVFPTRSYLTQRHDLAQAESRLQLLRSQRKQLDREAAKLGTDTEIERLARETYHLVKPGEQAYVVIPSASTTTAPAATTSTTAVPPTSASHG
ncbi:MAG: septum formation initiator [Actinomycetia bacterium]|nr:septum formation initiator [Actinomycetes bacterium]